MTDVAKIFRNGGSQAVRLPKKYRFGDETEVLICRDGQRVILQPRRRTWSEGFLRLAGSAGSFPYPEDPPPVEPGPNLD